MNTHALGTATGSPWVGPLLLATALVAAVACKDKADDDSGGDGGGDDVVTAVCTEPTVPGCIDQLILDLAMHDDKVSEGAVETTTEGDDFVTTIDATAGGYGNETNEPWVYVKFGPEGATRVDIDDEAALESMDWDLAARRFIIRLNGGASGPSCVGAAALLESEYDAVDAVPEGISFAVDDFYTEDCSLINDTSGLPGNPQVVLGGWWTYPSCVATTEVPHLVQLADGHVFKLVVEQYYASGQQDCNDGTGRASDGGNLRLRWQMLD